MEFNKKQLKQLKTWILALRSDKYSQTKMMLNNSKGYCCLGLACKILIPKNKLELDEKYINGGYPSNQKYAPEWLKEINNDFLNHTKSNKLDGKSLTCLNDSENFTFNEIADQLELVYIHKILK
jgi:hypothetical protein